jgi:hypothetical protein
MKQEGNKLPETIRNRGHLIIVIALILIIAVGVFLRIRHLDTTGIWEDQSFTLNTAMRWVNGGPMPLAANKSSVGVINPPMIEYLYAAALRLWPDVLSVAILTMLSGIVALVVTAWVTYRVFGPRAAILTTFLFALNPWSVFYSQLIWNQTMIPVFASLTLAFLLFYFTVEQRGYFLVLIFASAACMTQVHPGSAMQLFTIALIMVLYWRRLRLTWLLAGLILFVILYIPFILYEIGVGWGDLAAVLDIAPESSAFSNAAILVSLDLLHVRGLFQSASYTEIFDTLATILIGLSIVYAIVHGRHQFVRRNEEETAMREASAYVILLLWLIMPVLFYLRTSVYLQVYYVMGQWPAPFILIGVALAGAQRWLEARRDDRVGILASWSIVAIPLLALLVWQLVVNLQFQDARTNSSSDTMQIRHFRQALDQAESLAAERPGCALVVVSQGHQLENSQLSLFKEFSEIEQILLADGNSAVPIAAPCALYLDALPGSLASTWLASSAMPLPQADVQVNDETWRFYEITAGVQVELFAALEDSSEPINWNNGVSLVQYERGEIQTGDPLHLTLAWEVADQPQTNAYHVGTYLLTDDNQVVAQSDGPGFDSIQWRPGDRFVTWFDIPVPAELPPGAYRIAVAYYTWPGIERVDLATGNNTAFLEQIDLPEP